jgi:methylmalonyl-CoA mutase cobalamin-binding subunit
VTFAIRQRTSVAVFAAEPGTNERAAESLVHALRARGVSVVYLGTDLSAERVAAAVEDASADVIDVCVSGRGAVAFLCGLLRELARLECRRVRIVLHRVD